MESVNSVEKKLKAFGISLKTLIILVYSLWPIVCSVYAQDIKEPCVAGTFYSDNPAILSRQIDDFLKKADPEPIEGEIFALVSPHAGYEFSGRVAAYGYKLIKNKPYKTVIIIAPSHYFSFRGVSVYSRGFFKTPLGNIEIDKDFTQKLLSKDKDIIFEPLAFQEEHSLEVQLPLLQKVLSGFKIVPIIMGDCSFAACQKLAASLKDTIGDRKDVLVVASTDMYHGYDYDQADSTDNSTISYLQKMDAQGLYDGIRQGKLQLCGGFPVVSALILSKELGHNKIKLLFHTNSAIVIGRKIKGTWTVGYSSWVIDQGKSEAAMLNQEQRKKLLEIARNSIQVYLKTGRKLEVSETDSVLNRKMGAFVTLHERGQLRGCIGNMVGSQPLYLTVRDMAVEAAISDPRFQPVELSELRNIEIEISALSPLEKVDSADKIQLGVHGVVIQRGFRGGVFLPQVATETGWSKEEFLNNLCAQKAGLPADAWKDKATEIYIFSAEVFSEKEIKPNE